MAAFGSILILPTHRLIHLIFIFQQGEVFSKVFLMADVLAKSPFLEFGRI